MAQSNDSKHNALVFQQLSAVLKAQETRVALYQEFEDAYRDYLNEKCPPEQYASVCNILTEGFQEVSLEIQSIEKALIDSLQRKDIADMVRRLQEEEKQKLEKTVQLQMYTIQSRDGTKDYDESSCQCKQELKQSRDKICEILEEIRHERADCDMEELFLLDFEEVLALLQDYLRL